MDYLENIGEKVGLGNVDYDNIKKQASFFLRDKINSARLLLTDVTTSQLITEEATNDDEWGPATKTMAAISEACCRMDEYPRIMQVLHSRLALIGKKYWRQFLKTLTVIEFLLFHGPEQVTMEFSSDRDLIEDLTRFNYVSERGVDHGLVVRKKAKQVLKLLMEDDYLKEERSRAQKLTKTIFGQGSYQSGGGGSGASRYGGFGNTTTSSSASDGLMFDTDTDDYHVEKKFTAFEERILSEKRGSRQEKSRDVNEDNSTSEWRAFEDDTSTFSPKRNATDSNWADFSNSSPGMSPKLNGSSSFTGNNDLFDEEIQAPHSPEFATSSIDNAAVQSAPAASKIPVKDAKKDQPKVSGPRRSRSKLSNFALTTSSSGDFKLPPPPPPPGGSKVTITRSKPSQSAQGVPDLLDFGSESTGPSTGSASLYDDSLLSFETPSNVSKSDQAVMDLLGMQVPTTNILSDIESMDHHVSGDKVSATRSPGLTQLAPDLFDLSGKPTQNDSDAFAFLGEQLSGNRVDAVKNEGSQGGIPDFMNLNNETSSTSVLDLFGTVVKEPLSSSNLAVSGEQVPPGKSPSSFTSVSGLEDQTFLSERSSAGVTSSPEVVPDVFDALAPDFASFGVRDKESKPAAKPADDFFNLLS
ncbi:hypothetical protein M758_7G159100 [Ceratodon purpureus]|nr:hypothetical protein M758_7G159100 [Ceratodon purpureus]